jgi:hypothetical protein
MIRRLALALILALALGATACGGDDDDGGGNATEAQCQAWQADFDSASEGFDQVEPGTPAAERLVDAMSDADDKLRDGGCYDDG